MMLYTITYKDNAMRVRVELSEEKMLEAILENYDPDETIDLILEIVKNREEPELFDEIAESIKKLQNKWYED